MTERTAHESRRDDVIGTADGIAALWNVGLFTYDEAASAIERYNARLHQFQIGLGTTPDADFTPADSAAIVAANRLGQLLADAINELRSVSGDDVADAIRTWHAASEPLRIRD